MSKLFLSSKGSSLAMLFDFLDFAFTIMTQDQRDMLLEYGQRLIRKHDEKVRP